MSRDPGRFLATGHLDDDLRGRSVSGAFVTLSAQGVKLALHLGATAVLARILVPDDFGLVGMVTAITGLVVMFKDLGLSTATVQRDEVSHAQISTLFWVNLGFSAAATAVVALLAPLIAWLYGEPRVAGITVGLCGAILFGGLAVQHQALMRRQMRFRALAAIEIVAQAAAAGAATLAALAGAGYWALVVQHLVLAGVSLGGIWSVCGWWPGRPARGTGVRPMLAFGGNLTLFGLLNYAARNLDDVLIGRVWGAAALGFYTRAYALLMLPISQINAPLSGIAVSTLSRLQQQPERYARYYLRSINGVAWLTMPAVGLLGVLAAEVVRVVLGDGWEPVAGLFRILAAAAWINPIVQSAGWVLVSLGQADRLARWGLLFASVRCGAFAIGLPWGATGVATAYTVAAWALAPPILAVAYRYAPVTLGSAVRAIARPAAVAATVAVAAAAGRWLAGSAHPGWVLAAGTGAAGIAALALLAWPAVRDDIAALWSLRRELRK